jgi:hypothetical protein
MAEPVSVRALAIVIAWVGLILPSARVVAAEPDKPKLVVLDIELTGDLGGPQFAAEHAARLKKESDILRQQLANSGLYQIVDTTPAQALITRLKSQQLYWHDCNGCDLQVGKQLGADQVLVTWVDRVSGLILSLTYEFHGVADGQILGRKSYDFRGDNDAAWTHAIKYMVRDLKENKGTQEDLDKPAAAGHF